MLAYLAITTTIILFSTIEVAVKAMGFSMDPMFLATIRFGLAGILMIAIEHKKLKNVSKKDLIILGIIGVLGIGGTFGPFHIALHNTDAHTVALIFSLNPLFASIAATFMLKEKLSIRSIIALILGFYGGYFVLFGTTSPDITSVQMPLLVLWSAIAFGLYTTISKKMVQIYGPLLTTGLIFIFGALTLSLFIKTWALPVTLKYNLILLYLIFGTTFLGYFFFFYGLKRVPISVGTSLFYLKPILATILSILVLKKFPDSDFYIGMVIIFISLTLSLKLKKQK